MKRKNKVRLQEDNIRYCKQIGILDAEIPRLVTSRTEINELYARRINPNRRRVATKNVLGRCLYSIRTIYVAEHTSGGYINEKRPMKRKGWYVLKRRPWNYRAQRETLVHELVHYRFPNLSHGRKFEEKIREILRGKSFEPKHIHLYAGYSKRWTQEIDRI